MDDLARHIEMVHAAHERLVNHLDAMTGRPGAVSTLPCLLPGWTRGHLLTHVARNADSFVRVLEAARRGESVTQYAGGVDGRNADIEAGAPRPWDEQVADVRTSAARLDEVLAGQSRWDLSMTSAMGDPVPHTEIPFRRLREVLVHHADLGDDGYTAADWPADYVREDLRRMEMMFNARKPMGLTGLPDAARQVEPLHRLRWLLGRADIEGLDPAGIF